MSNNALILAVHAVNCSVFAARFREVLLGRLAQGLALKEQTEVSPAEWLNAEARKRQALQEGGTLR